VRKKRVVFSPALTHNNIMEYSNSPEQHKQYLLIKKALAYLQVHQQQQPALADLAAMLHTSPGHLQRVFQNWAGVTPKQFLSHLTRQAALGRLQTGATIFTAALASGLSGSSRLHDLSINTTALTPGQVRTAGRGIDIEWGFVQSPFGDCLLAWTDRGLNFLGFASSLNKKHLFAQLQQQWHAATFYQNTTQAEIWKQQIFAESESKPIKLWLSGSPFQLKVWEALLQIPANANVSYADLAQGIGKPGAARAIGSALAKNPIAYLIPCHRVIRKMGVIGDYRWGSEVKMALLGYENCQFERSTSPRG